MDREILHGAEERVSLTGASPGATDNTDNRLATDNTDNTEVVVLCSVQTSGTRR
jgi:hypothetical protein